ncbi:MAG: ankyrin repeat domain-containing protein [Actinomycetota bacterium]|nr:ankyrin repeat domain-containing protein [Actinomycetota bacterium]
MDAAPDPEAVSLAHRIFDLARAGAAEDIASYIDAGVPVDLTDAHGNTLLMLAAYHCQAEVVAALLARGADPDRMNDRGQTPLAGAVFKQAYDVIDELRRAGADPDLGAPSARQTVQFFGVDVEVDRLT